MTPDDRTLTPGRLKKIFGFAALAIGVLLLAISAVRFFDRTDAVIRFPLQSGQALTIDVNLKSVNGMISPWMYTDAGEDFFFRPEVVKKTGDVILSTGLLYANMSDQERRTGGPPRPFRGGFPPNCADANLHQFRRQINGKTAVRLYIEEVVSGYGRMWDTVRQAGRDSCPRGIWTAMGFLLRVAPSGLLA